MKTSTKLGLGLFIPTILAGIIIGAFNISLTIAIIIVGILVLVNTELIFFVFALDHNKKDVFDVEDTKCGAFFGSLMGTIVMFSVVWAITNVIVNANWNSWVLWFNSVDWGQTEWVILSVLLIFVIMGAIVFVCGGLFMLWCYINKKLIKRIGIKKVK